MLKSLVAVQILCGWAFTFLVFEMLLGWYLLGSYIYIEYLLYWHIYVRQYFKYLKHAVIDISHEFIYVFKTFQAFIYIEISKYIYTHIEYLKFHTLT